MQPGTKAAFLFPGNDVDYSKTLKKLSKEENFAENLRKVNELAHTLNLIGNDDGDGYDGCDGCDGVNGGNKGNADDEGSAGSKRSTGNAVAGNAVNVKENSDANSENGETNDILAGNNELYNQMVIYAMSCSICDLYKSRNIFPSLVAGYSLGMYSSFYAAGVYSFEAGLSIVIETFNLIKQFYEDRELDFGMGAIVGLTEQEIMNLVFGKVDGFLEIACRNGHRSFTLVGENRAIRDSLELAQRLGALKTIRINTKFGYHTSLLKGNVDKLYPFLDNFTICEPQCKILSPFSLSLVSKDTVPHELVKYPHSAVCWQHLIEALVDNYGIREGYEVGPGESLAKITRYVNQNFKVYTF